MGCADICETHATWGSNQNSKKISTIFKILCIVFDDRNKYILNGKITTTKKSVVINFSLNSMPLLDKVEC